MGRGGEGVVRATDHSEQSEQTDRTDCQTSLDWHTGWQQDSRTLLLCSAMGLEEDGARQLERSGSQVAHASRGHSSCASQVVPV